MVESQKYATISLMNEINRNIWSPYKKFDHSRKSIKRLDSDSINRIAAGEVIERPAAAIKELVENSLDANSRTIKIYFSNGGKSFLKVVDDGWGIPMDELKLAVDSHATSKTSGKDLLNINTFGFRGEALPSIGAVARLNIRSREISSSESGELEVIGGKIGMVRPVALEKGTIVELTDLFYATPARKKFLRSDQVETRAIVDVFKRLAIGNPDIKISLSEINNCSEKKIFDLSVDENPNCLLSRISHILGTDFTDNSVDVKKEHLGYSLTGYTCLPTYSKGSAIQQYFYVNGRPVKDKQLNGALRVAYFDFISKERFPTCVLFINCDSSLVDINVHPMKSEVRFRHPSDVRGLVISGIKEALALKGLKSNTVLSEKILNSFNHSYQTSQQHFLPDSQTVNSQLEFYRDQDSWTSGRVEQDLGECSQHIINCQLGAARAQIHGNYIVAQTLNGLVLVDQHAAHERIVYEQLKNMKSQGKISSQVLLIPEIVEVSVEVETAVLSFIENFHKLGFDIESFGPGSLCVRGIPSILGNADPKLLVNDVLDELLEKGSVESISQKIDSIISRISCHGSIRSGKKLTGDEMNQLLRKMEKVPFSAQCNHGRPTFVELKLEDIEKLFGRR